MKDQSLFSLVLAISAILVVAGASMNDTLMLGIGELAFILSVIGMFVTNK